MRFLILGGNGYLGSKIINELSKDKHRIVATKRDRSDISRVKTNNIFWIPAKAEAIKTAMLYESFDWILFVIMAGVTYYMMTVLQQTFSFHWKY